MKRLIKIDGMGCQNCVAHVKEALKNLDGVNLLDVKIGEASVDIPEGYDFKKIIEALDDAGYEVEE